jgi:DNA-binding response OmpR family regulator
MKPQRETILVVDDDVDTCRNLSDILTDLGYHVDTAHDGSEALGLVRSHPYDVALLDLKMPGMDGVELYREIKRLRAGTVAIIVTAYASSKTAEEALSAGAWQILAKPVDFPRLLKLVDEALGQPLVLVVDDDEQLCATLWDLLRERGYRVCLAHDERTAAVHLKGVSFAVVLIDLKLPDGDGSQVFRLVRSANPQARTVLITGHRSELEERVRQVLQEGADAVCYKPFDVPGLLSTFWRWGGRGGLSLFSWVRPPPPPKTGGLAPPLAGSETASNRHFGVSGWVPYLPLIRSSSKTTPIREPTCATSWSWMPTALKPRPPLPRPSTAATGSTTRRSF